ncbi:FAD-dependent oxidoreductase [Rhodohalobacter sp. 614A]|uniref:FAD-dependent oxidoreductase n=1 Tax=Rhodohalobacter sp. 614A TaxID=2908649 RepID=UPI001F2B54E4|nr:FAD-dependent oxidoreductase [Rhodohalobacter sp. 614A]
MKWLSIILILIISITIEAATSVDSNAKKVDDKVKTEVLVYGATPSGIMTAISVKREGKSVLIVEPSKWVGGILGAGLKPLQDMPNYEAVGGTTRDILKVLGADSLEQHEMEGLAHNPHGQYRGLMEKQSPREIRSDFLDLLEEYGIRVIYDHRVSHTLKKKTRIVEAVFDLAPFDSNGLPPAEAQTDDHLRVEAEIFIDASYEGELMARSGVSNRVGRESKMDYGEEFAGVRPLGNLTPISPFVEPGDPQSGLLAMVEDDHGKEQGAGDHYTQAYNYRFYVTSDPDRRVPITPPEDYDPMDYELVGRYVEYIKETAEDREELEQQLSMIFPGWINSGVYNYQRASLITMAPLGISHVYAGGDYGTKARVWKAHQDYLRGLHHFLSTDERVPAFFREQTESLGLDGYHHPDTNGWPHQLYIRVSRRMVGEYTITAHDVYNRTQIEDPIGLAQYGIDTYPSRRIWFTRNDTTYVAIEGNMFVGGSRGPTNVPYPIPYRSITPQRHEVTNLLVPVLFSASHLGYASARMEPTFMIAGESAGVAAAQAMEEGVGVQDIDMERYLNRLRELNQRLEWNQK